MKKIIYSLLLALIFISCKKENTTLNDIDSQNLLESNDQLRGQGIARVTIGTQVWMSSNLNVIKYRNGDTIPMVSNQTKWANLTTGAWCYYLNKSANGKVVGRLYNWYAVNDSRGLAPLGWHIPSEPEWQTLTTFLGGQLIAGGKMKSTSILWNAPNTGATNSSGFTALPGGKRTEFEFREFGLTSQFWSSTAISPIESWAPYLDFDRANITECECFKNQGYYVRCIKKMTIRNLVLPINLVNLS